MIQIQRVGKSIRVTHNGHTSTHGGSEISQYQACLDVLKKLFETASNSLNVNEIKVGDEINFNYKGESRYLDVEKVDSNYIEGTLLKEDLKYDVDDCYRKFSVNKVLSVKLLN